MRFRHPDGSIVHLAYCTNVHPAEDVDGIVAQLERFAGRVRARSASACSGSVSGSRPRRRPALAGDPRALERLRSALDGAGARGRDAERLPVPRLPRARREAGRLRPGLGGRGAPRHTRSTWPACSRACCPDDADEGTISTLPLGMADALGRRASAVSSRAHLERLATELASRAETGVRVRVGLEPEPGCIVETTRQAGVALRRHRSRVGRRLRRRLPPGGRSSRTRRPRSEALADRGVPIVKAQVSSALRIAEPRSPRRPRRSPRTPSRASSTRPASAATAASSASTISTRRSAAACPARPSGGSTSTCRSTPAASRRRSRARATLAALVGGPAPQPRHLEVETYTWTVLPPDRRPADDAGLVEALAHELAWTSDRLLRARARGGHVKNRLLVLDIVGMTPQAARAHARASRRSGATGSGPSSAPSCPRSPAPSSRRSSPACRPREHGIVGNGWYFRGLGEVFLWRQHNALVQGEKLWETARARPTRSTRAANLCWWYAMGATTDMIADAAPDLPRRRAQVAGLLHGARRRSATS